MGCVCMHGFERLQASCPVPIVSKSPTAQNPSPHPSDPGPPGQCSLPITWFGDKAQPHLMGHEAATPWPVPHPKVAIGRARLHRGKQGAKRLLGSHLIPGRELMF